MSLYYGVICPKCGDVQLSPEEYRTQMLAPGCGWRCPECWGPAQWDDAKHDASCEAAQASIEREILPLPTAEFPSRFIGLLTLDKTVTGRVMTIPACQNLQQVTRKASRLVDLDFSALELHVIAAGYGGRSLVSHLGYQPEDG